MRASATQQVLISYSGTANKCDPVTFSPNGGAGLASYDVLLSTVTTGAHIFYTVALDPGVTPTHSGDNATGITTRIGANSGSIHFNVSNNTTKIVEALAYKSGIADSDITEAAFDGIQT